MKKLIIVTFLLVEATLVKAQYNSLGLYNPHFTFNKAEFIPSKLGTNNTRLEFRVIPNFYTYAGNSLMSINSLMYPSTSAIDEAVNDANDYSIFGAGLEIPSIAVSYKIGKKKELMTLALTSKTRVLANTLLGDNFIKMLWNGNKQFEGQTIDLGKFGASSIAATEFGIGWAMPIEISGTTVRFGASFKYLLASGGGYLPETSSTMETAVDGKYITFNDLRYHVDVAYPDEDNFFTGSGFAIDLSTTIAFAENMNASVSVLDIGSLSFDKNTYSYTGSGNFTFQGVVLNNVFEDHTIDVDSLFLSDISTESDSNHTFSMGLPTRLVVHLEKNITGDKDYTKHGIYLTYIQGFNNIAGATTKPYFSAGYSYSLKNILNVGPTINYGGYAGFGVGMFLSAKAGPFRIGAGSNTGLSYLIMPDVSKSVDLSFMTTWSIGKGKKEKSAAKMN